MLIIGLFSAGMSPGFSYPPLSDAITRLVEKGERDWIYTTINSGTSIGIILSAPAALYFLSDWRLCMLTFAAISAVVTIWNWFIMPVGPFVENTIHARWPITAGWLVNGRSIPLFLSAFLFGCSSAIYWVFSPDFLVNTMHKSEYFVTMFWLFLGLAGLLGATAGSLVRQLGLRLAIYCMLSGYAISLLLFIGLPTSSAAVLASSALFGVTFIAVTGIYGVWSMRVFAERPSAGFGLVFLLISIGQFLAPVAGGAFAEMFNAQVMFITAALIGLSCLLFLPNTAMTRMSPEKEITGPSPEQCGSEQRHPW